ncbi:hypothetical protein RB195_013596 [Necator americanus]|uniref:C-type lectin domain-containing protein n=1 Tax=Necator americanus TaxID=51031 RepID=A0ABR1DWG7_NECAM
MVSPRLLGDLICAIFAGTIAVFVHAQEEEGWVTFDGNQYGFFDHEASFDEAEEICVHYGGHLVSIHSQAENDFVHSMTYPLTSHSYNEMVWLGGRRASPPFDNQWTWTDGSPFDYTNWDDGEPDYYQAIEKCLQLLFDQKNSGRKEKRWNDIRCDSPMPHFVCKR